MADEAVQRAAAVAAAEMEPLPTQHSFVNGGADAPEAASSRKQTASGQPLLAASRGAMTTDRKRTAMAKEESRLVSAPMVVAAEPRATRRR
jgi:hypothetical protein